MRRAMEVWAILRRLPSRCFWRRACVRITIINGGVQMVIYFPCTHGTKSVLSLGTQHHKTRQKLVETISFNELLLP